MNAMDWVVQQATAPRTNWKALAQPVYQHSSRMVLECLQKSNEPLTRGEIQERTGLRPGQVGGCLKRLRHIGFVALVEKTRWVAV